MKEEQKQVCPETSLDASRVFPRLQITDLEALLARVVKIFEPGMLAEGCCHQIVAPYQSGKTFLALVCANEFLESDLKVLYLDYENRKSSIKERLDLLGTKAGGKDNFLYVNHPNLDLSQDSQDQWAAFLEHHKPDLVIFDSQNGFLSSAGKEENSATGFQEWANVYLEVPKVLGITTLVIDHTGWDGGHSRGTSRKPDQFDIIWKVKVVRSFSRRSVGQLELKLVKDRDSLISEDCLTFEMGGDPFQFRSDVTDTKSDDLPDDQKKTLSLISQNSKDQIGTRRKDIDSLFNGSKSRADKTIKALLAGDVIYQPEESKLYWIVDSSMDSSSNTESPENSNQGPELDSSVDAVNGNGEGVLGSRSFRTGPIDPVPRTEPNDSSENEENNDTSIRKESAVLEHCPERSITENEELILEAIESSDYNERGVEVLTMVASILFKHPMLLTDLSKGARQHMRSTVISLAEEQGVELTEADVLKALKLLFKDYSVLELLERKVKDLMFSTSTANLPR